MVCIQLDSGLKHQDGTKNQSWHPDPIYICKSDITTTYRRRGKCSFINQSWTLWESTAYDSVLSGSPPDVKSVHRSKTRWEENPGLLYCRSIETGDARAYLCCLTVLLLLSISRKRSWKPFLTSFWRGSVIIYSSSLIFWSTKVYRDHICERLSGIWCLTVFLCLVFEALQTTNCCCVEKIF